jgi:TRAP-type C4-dicarboxylate transport system permease small subunit
MPAKSNRNILDVIMDAMAYLAGVLLMLVTVTVAVSVTLRYLRFKSPIWVLQYTEYALLWITFLGAAWLLKHDGHIRIDSIIMRFSDTARRKLSMLNCLIGSLVSAVVCWFGALHTVDLIRRGVIDVKATSVPKALIFWIIPVGGLMLSIQFIRRLVALAKSPSR